MKLIIFFAASFFLTFFVTPLIIYFAKKYDCIDRPGKRRLHKDPTPRWGGIAFFIGVLPVYIFLKTDKQIAAYLIAAIILVILGSIDDFKRLGWKVKFLGMILATSVTIFYGNTVIHYLGTYSSHGKVSLGIFSVPFTFFGVIGVTNAVNLIDGLNGLAGGISLIAMLFIGITGYYSGNYVLGFLAIALAGALAGFLKYNFPKARIFMGDSGSLFLGFSIAVFSIFLTQDERFHVDPMFPVLLLSLPIFDTLRVILLRAFTLKNPFKADKTHLHHLMVRKRFSPVLTVLIFWSLTFIFGLLATLMMERTSTPYLLTVLFISFLLSVFADSLVRRR